MNTFEVNTPNGLTESRTITNKILQRDVLAPFVSINMVDVNISKKGTSHKKFLNVQEASLDTPTYDARLYICN